MGKAAAVQALSPVLAGHARRSGGALPYHNEEELGTALDLLVGEAGLRDRLGAAGKRYVIENFTWSEVLGRHESLLDLELSSFSSPQRQR